MRTATRIALVLTGTAILIVAMATPGVWAGRGRIDEETITAHSTLQRARPQSQPGRIDYVQVAKVVSVATAIAHPSSAPEVANLDRGERWGKSEVAVADEMDGTWSESAASPASCNGDTFATQQRNASDGGRGSLAEDSVGGSCPEIDKPRPRTRQAIVGDLEQMQIPRPEAMPVVVKFEAVISINFAGLDW